ncbi:hypothetical protein [Halocatena marina]|uniref:Uncharacterized protein n=1 Tax=Halocatena marina TaxID=2934937 RepID=A0ABD5YLK7_9EURY|nr:hypothetical protein [Halocatena marina]
MNTSGLGQTLRSERINALLAWVLVGFVAVVAVVNIGIDPLWAGFAACVAVLGVIPAVAVRSLRAMLPWEVLALASLPLLAQTFRTPGTGQIATYLAVAAVALIVAVELHVFTPVDMNYSFAVLFVVVTTMAAAGVWAIIRWSADIYLGISFGLTERELMFEFVASTVAGLLAGIIFELYFRRFIRAHERLEVDI